MIKVDEFLNPVCLCGCFLSSIIVNLFERSINSIFYKISLDDKCNKLTVALRHDSGICFFCNLSVCWYIIPLRTQTTISSNISAEWIVTIRRCIIMMYNIQRLSLSFAPHFIAEPCLKAIFCFLKRLNDPFSYFVFPLLFLWSVFPFFFIRDFEKSAYFSSLDLISFFLSVSSPLLLKLLLVIEYLLRRLFYFLFTCLRVKFFDPINFEMILLYSLLYKL